MIYRHDYTQDEEDSICDGALAKIELIAILKSIEDVKKMRDEMLNE